MTAKLVAGGRAPSTPVAAQLRWFDATAALEAASATGYEDGPDFPQTADHTQPVASSARPTSSGVQ